MYKPDQLEPNHLCEQYIQKCHNNIMHFRHNFIKLEECINDKLENQLFNALFMYENDAHIYKERHLLKSIYDFTDEMILSTNRNE
jgi:hypothetical protein